MRTKHLPIFLDGETYARLEQVAQAEERDPLQQARWLLKRALLDDHEPRPEPNAVDCVEVPE